MGLSIGEIMEAYVEIDKNYKVLAVHTSFPEVNHNVIIPILGIWLNRGYDINSLVGLVIASDEYKPSGYLEETIASF
jgi:hypothetical protein